jgi:hypothetical protein
MSTLSNLRSQLVTLKHTADKLYADPARLDAANIMYDRYLGVEHKYKSALFHDRLPMLLLSVSEHLIQRRLQG